MWKKALLKEAAEQNLVIVVREPAVSYQKGHFFMNYTGQGSMLIPLFPESQTPNRGYLTTKKNPRSEPWAGALASLILVVLKTSNTRKHFKCIPHAFLPSL